MSSSAGSAVVKTLVQVVTATAAQTFDGPAVFVTQTPLTSISCARSVSSPGSLLDDFTPPPQCLHEYTLYAIPSGLASSWYLSPGARATCYPSGWNPDCVNQGYYPTYGLGRCPAGYSPVNTDIAGGTTTLACCESGLSTINASPIINGDDMTGFCTGSFPTIEDSTLLYITPSEATKSSTSTTVLSSITDVVKIAYPIYVQFTNEQIPITGTTTLTPTASTTSPPVIHKTGLSTAAKYGFSIGMPLLAIVLLLGVALVVRRLRQRENGRRLGSADREQYEKPELAGEDMPRREMDTCSQVLHELPTMEIVHEIDERPSTPVEMA